MGAKQIKEHQLWSSDPIDAVKVFYDSRTNQIFTPTKFFQNDCADNRHWATNPNVVREAFYDYGAQVKIENNKFASLQQHMYKSLYADREKIIEKLKTCLKGYIGITKLNKLLELNSSKCYSNYNTNKKEDSACDNNDNTFEELNESILNDQGTVIDGLVNCLKMYTNDDEINKLLDVKSLDQFDPRNHLQYILTYFKNIFNKRCDQTVTDIQYADCSSQYDDNSRGDLAENKCNDRPICSKIQVSDEDCSETKIKLNDALDEIEEVKRQWLAERQLREAAGYNFLLELRKAELCIKK